MGFYLFHAAAQRASVCPPQILFVGHHQKSFHDNIIYSLFSGLVHGKKSMMILPPIPKTFISRQISIHACKFSSSAATLDFTRINTIARMHWFVLKLDKNH